MTDKRHDVVVTGIGLVTALGVGRQAHGDILLGKAAPARVIDSERYAPYTVYPLPEIDWSEQIPRRGDQRQMENWQRLGVYAAGLALDDAGLKDDLEACASMDMIVAAGGGERDIAVGHVVVRAGDGDGLGLVPRLGVEGELRGRDGGFARVAGRDGEDDGRSGRAG